MRNAIKTRGKIADQNSTPDDIVCIIRVSEAETALAWIQRAMSRSGNTINHQTFEQTPLKELVTNREQLADLLDRLNKIPRDTTL